MASSINASTSGGGGIITTADATGNLNIQSGGSTVVAVTSAGATVTGTLAATGAVSGTTGVFTGAVTTPLSYVRLNTANGYGSTNTMVRRFTNIVNNVGTDITYADSATLGGTFTINTAGVYSVSYSDQYTYTSVSRLGVSINSTELTTEIQNITVANILGIGSGPSANNPGSVSATFYATATAVIRAHTQGIATGANPNCCQFTIARVQ